MTKTVPQSVGDVDSFVTLLRVACEDPVVNAQLARLLSLPDVERQTMVRTWVSDMVVAQAPRDLIQAVACLLDDAVAREARRVIQAQ